MKKILMNVLAISSVTLLMLSSCKKNDALVTSNGGKAGALTANVTTLPLNKAMVNDTTTVIRFSFQAANFGYSAAVVNTLQIDADGDNWANPTSVTLNNKVYSQGYSTAAFNAILLKLNLPAGVASKVNVRVANAISTSSTVPAAYTNVLSLTVTPFNLTSWIYVVGQFQGWSISTPDSLISVTGNGIYTGVITFPAQTGGSNQFLIVPAKNWNNKYATTANPDTATTSSNYSTEYVTGGGNNFVLKNKGGVYILTINTNANTLTIVPADYYSLIGNDFAGQNWDTDNWMKYINDGNGNWVATLPMIAPSGGGFKIRQDGQWTNSWGFLHVPDGVTLTDATGSTGASNMSIPAAGTYKVTFNMPVTSFGTAPQTLVPYTLTAQ